MPRHPTCMLKKAIILCPRFVRAVVTYSINISLPTVGVNDWTIFYDKYGNFHPVASPKICTRIPGQARVTNRISQDEICQQPMGLFPSMFNLLSHSTTFMIQLSIKSICPIQLNSINMLPSLVFAQESDSFISNRSHSS